MHDKLTDADLDGLCTAYADRLDGLLDEAPMPDDPAELERMALIAAAPIWEEEIADELGPAFVDALEERGDLAAAILLSASSTLTTAIRDQADVALERLKKAGIEPTLPDGFGELRAVEARRAMLGDGAELFSVRLERPQQKRSQIAQVIVAQEDEISGRLVKGMISEPLVQKEADSFFELESLSPRMVSIVPVSVDEVGQVLLDTATRMANLNRSVTGELALSLPLLGQAIYGDVNALGSIPIGLPGSELYVDPGDEDRFEALRDELTGDFGGWIEEFGEHDALKRNGTFVAEAMLSWKWGYADGCLGYWTIDDLDEFFLNYAPRKLPSDQDVTEDALHCAASFLQFLDEVGDLAGDPVEELVPHCTTLETEFVQAAKDRSNWGPAKALITQMEAEGVELTGQTALDGWVRDFNSRSHEERDKIVGPSMDRQFVEAITGDPDAPAPWEIGGAMEHARDGSPTAFAIAWFPAGEYEAAMEQWHDLGELWGEVPHGEYCRRMEATFRGWALRGVRPKIVPLRLTEYVAWCDQRSEEPTEARAGYAADMLRLGLATPWPPSRNEMCWCGSQQKYKKCCGTVAVTALSPLDAVS